MLIESRNEWNANEKNPISSWILQVQARLIVAPSLGMRVGRPKGKPLAYFIQNFKLKK